MRSVKPFVGGLVVMGSVGFGGVAHAANYYVSTSGSDGRSCAQAQSVSTPKLTLNNSLGCLRPGDTLFVRGGTYSERIDRGVPSGTSWSSTVRIAAYPGETVWMSPASGSQVLTFGVTQQYIEFDGINLDGRAISYEIVRIDGWLGGNAHHIRIQNAELIAAPKAGQHVLVTALVPGVIGGNQFINLRVHGGGASDFDHGFYIGSSDNLIDGCEIYDFTGAAIQLYNGYGLGVNNTIVRNNRIHDARQYSGQARGYGVMAAGGSGHQIYNNLIYNIPNLAGESAGIILYGAANSEVYNNTVYGNGGFGIVVEGGTPGSVIRNNISYGNQHGNYANYGGGTFESDNLTSDPRFVNPGGGDFSLRSDSPAIDRGAFLGAVRYDLIGVPRPQGGGYDIGAFEFGLSGSSSPAPPPAPEPEPSPSPGASPSGTTIPGAGSIVDNSLAVWTLSGFAILRNGVHAANGYGYQILWYEGTIYVIGDDYNWWRWVDNNWSFYSSAPPN